MDRSVHTSAALVPVFEPTLIVKRDLFFFQNFYRSLLHVFCLFNNKMGLRSCHGSALFMMHGTIET